VPWSDPRIPSSMKPRTRNQHSKPNATLFQQPANALSFERSRDWESSDLDGMSRLFEASSGWTMRMDASRADLTLRMADAPLEPG